MKRIKHKTMILTLSVLLACSLTACGGFGDNGKNEPEEGMQTEENTASTNEDIQEKEAATSYGILSEGDTAPDFTASLTDGTVFTLSEQQGKVVLLNFWATWCGPCVREMPAFEKLHEEYGEDVAILAVNCMEDEGIVDAFLDESGYTFPIAYDTEGDIILKYPSQGIPYTLVIDGEGIIQKIYVGAADAETQYQEYKSAIDAVTGGTS